MSRWLVIYRHRENGGVPTPTVEKQAAVVVHFDGAGNGPFGSQAKVAELIEDRLSREEVFPFVFIELFPGVNMPVILNDMEVNIDGLKEIYVDPA